MATVQKEAFFVMHGARTAIAGGMAHTEKQVKALELAVTENTGLAFDLAKTLIESTCKTILKERENAFEKDDDLPKLFKAVIQTIPFLPVDLASDRAARKSLKQTLSGLNVCVQGICELRNAFGFASHGSEGPRPPMEGVQALLVAQSADAIIGFLYRCHQQDIARATSMPLQYGDNPAFNDWIDDESEPVQILSLPPYQPSDVLFNIDLQAYSDLLTDYGGQVDETTQDHEVAE